MRYRCAVLDDYQNVALKVADWSRVTGDVDVTVFNERLGDEAAVAHALQGFGIVCVMRERTPFPRSLIAKLPDLKLIVTTGLKNAAIDVAAAKERGITVCGTEGAKHPTAELAIGLMIDLARSISVENARMKAGEAWQATVGADLYGHTSVSSGLAISASASPKSARPSA
jgi:phosphoglycerate dehydrogenase-like enzyme